MKFLLKIVISLIIFSLAGSVAAQQLNMMDGIVRYQNRDYPAVIVQMEPDPKTVKKTWEDYIRREHDINMKGIGFLTNKDVLTAEEVSFPAISSKNMDFYTKVIEENDATKMMVFATLGYDIPIDKDRNYKEYIAMKAVVSDFIDNFLPAYYMERLETAKSAVAGLEDDQKDLHKDIEDNQKEIEDLRKENEKLQKKLNETQAELQAALELLSKRRTKLETIKDQLAIINR